jgi:hypothetical protein
LFFTFGEQFAGWTYRTLDLPLRGAPIVPQRIECANFGKSCQFIPSQMGLRY